MHSGFCPGFYPDRPTGAISFPLWIYIKISWNRSGITEPTPSFSPAFGEAFLTLHPTMYSKTLIGKMKEHGAKAYLVNTGWNGTGKRISLKDTRAIIDAIIDGSIDKAKTNKVPVMNLEFLLHCRMFPKISWIREILMRIALIGKLKLKIWLRDISNILSSLQIMKKLWNWFLRDRYCQKFIRTKNRNASNFGSVFLLY
jgi:hypothetical protein